LRASDLVSGSRELVASRLHTVVVLLILGVMAAGGIVSTARGTIDLVGSEGRVAFYARVLAVELLLLWFVQTGIRRSGYSLRALIDDSVWNPARWLRYVLIGVAGWILWMAAGAGLGFFLQPSPQELRRVLQILPQARSRNSAGWGSPSARVFVKRFFTAATYSGSFAR